MKLVIVGFHPDTFIGDLASEVLNRFFITFIDF